MSWNAFNKFTSMLCSKIHLENKINNGKYSITCNEIGLRNMVLNKEVINKVRMTVEVIEWSMTGRYHEEREKLIKYAISLII